MDRTCTPQRLSVLAISHGYPVESHNGPLDSSKPTHNLVRKRTWGGAWPHPSIWCIRLESARWP